jgi:hypothetical protein
LKGTLVKLKAPASSVVADRSRPLTGLWIVTVAFGTTAPDGSVTRPSILEAFPPVWAGVTITKANVQKTKNKTPKNALAYLNVFSLYECGLDALRADGWMNVDIRTRRATHAACQEKFNCEKCD